MRARRDRRKGLVSWFRFWKGLAKVWGWGKFGGARVWYEIWGFYGALTGRWALREELSADYAD